MGRVHKKQNNHLVPVMIISVVFAAVIAMFFIVRINVEKKMESLEEEVVAYLTEEKDYALDDILGFRAYRSKGSEGADFPVEVSFVDEPNVYYQYIKRDGKIMQTWWQEVNYKDVEPKHREPSAWN